MSKENRLKELVHYICSKCKDSSSLGAVKLNKILWFADSIVYKKTGQSITQCRYKKLQHGPVPTEIMPVLRELEEEGAILIEVQNYYGLTKKKFTSLIDPCTDSLSNEELKFVDMLISVICDNYTAASISEASHDIVWGAARMGEEIPLNAILANDEAILDERDLQWAKEIVEQRTFA
jgi:Protein of unknown function (DUF4065)